MRASRVIAHTGHTAATQLRRRTSRRLAAAVVATGALALPMATTGPAVAATSHHFTPGAPGVGDPYFPNEGNGGYDVAHYDLNLAYDPAGHHLAGVATITATATQGLSRFDLDFSGLVVRSIAVDGAAATWTREGQELRITPAHGLVDGSRFTVAVHYDGSPKTIVGSPIVFGADYGWQYTKDGAFVGDEPNGARTWYPANDHPSDKATFTYHVTVPAGRSVVANGELVGRSSSGGRSTFVWNETRPMATYLATVDIGRWDFRTGTTPGGIPELMASDPALKGAVNQARIFAVTAAVTDFWATKFGPYPFTSTGAIVDNVPDVGFSLETQTRPLYGFAADQFTVAHELSHQWFGDSVSVRTWQDIWLNEGFATFAADLWNEHLGQGSTYSVGRSIFGQIPAASSFWQQSIADPKRDTMFSSAVYERGALTLEALRHRLGDRTFFALLQRWTSEHRYGNASTAQFVALAEQVSGQDLTSFFHIWLWRQAKPSSFNAG